MIKDTFNKIKIIISNINKGYKSFINKKPLYYITQFFPRNILLLILFIVTIIFSFSMIKTNDVLMRGTSFNSFHDEIIDESLYQDLNTKKITRFNKIGIIFSTYNRNNTSKYIFNLYQNNIVIYSEEIDSSKLIDCETVYFKFKTIKVYENDKYKFEIKPIDASKGNAITVPINTNKKAVSYEIRANSEFNTFIRILFIIFVLLFLIINYLINNNIINYKNIYILFLVYLIPILFLYPALQVPDEKYHFSNAYSLSQYDFTKTPYSNQKKKIETSKNFKCLLYASATIEDYLDNVSDKERLINCFKSEEKVYRKSINDVSYSKIVAYIVPAFGIKIGSLFTKSPIILFYIGRLFNFALSFLILIYALKKLPKYNNLILLVIMIPTFIQQMISYSYDSLLNALCILVMCLLIKFNNDKKIDKKELIIYIISSLIIYNIKAPYILIPLLILFIDKGKFGIKNKKIKYIITLLLISYFGSKLLNIFPTIGKEVSTVVSTNSGSNLSYLVHNPIRILSIAKNTIILRGKWYFITMIGSLGWLRYQLDDFIIITYILILLLVTMSYQNNISKQKRILSLIIMSGLLFGIFLSMYIGWSSYKLYYVEGVQGRYFLPLIIPILYNFIPKKKMYQLDDKFIFQYINIVTFYYLVNILVCFY